MTPRIQACLNGARARGFHPALPLSPEELARDAAACAAAGAALLHVHPRDAAGAESLAPEVIGAVVEAIRAAAPGLPVSVSTGDWIERDDARRLAHIRAWAALAARPDEASVNLAEPTAPEVMAALAAGGIGLEAGLASAADARRFLAQGVPCRRVLVEMDDTDDAAAVAEEVLAILDAAGHAAERQLHGFGRSAWPLARMAAARGMMLRIGLEDMDALPDGTPAPGNAALVRAALTSCWP